MSLLSKLKNKIFSPAFFKLVILALIIFSAYEFIKFSGVPLNLGDKSQLIAWFNEKGAWAPIYIFAIDLVIILIPFIPNQIVHIAVAALYTLKGELWVAIVIIYLSSQIGWSINYFLGRKLGRHFVEDIVGENIGSLDQKIQKANWKVFTLLGMTPGFSYDVIAYAAGVMKASYKDFVIGGLLGTLVPFLSTMLIGNLTAEKPWIGVAAFGIGLVATVVATIVTHRKMKEKSV